MSILEIIRVTVSRAFSSLQPRRVDEDFQKELASHLELMTEDNIRRGMAPEEARRRARCDWEESINSGRSISSYRDSCSSKLLLEILSSPAVSRGSHLALF